MKRQLPTPTTLHEHRGEDSHPPPPGSSKRNSLLDEDEWKMKHLFSDGDSGTTNSIAAAAAAPPTLIHKGKSTSIYRQGDTGFKVIEDPDPTEEMVLQLLTEEQVSRYLPPRCAQRKVLQVKSFQANPAFYFRWVEGITLKEWLHNIDNRDASLRQRLRIATAITKSLSEFHEGNVCHQYLTLENIILDLSDGHCHASLINLSRAVIILEATYVEAREMKKRDLHDLGLVLNALFRGECVADDGQMAKDDRQDNEEPEDTSSSGQQRKRGNYQYSGEGLPLYMSSLISTLIISDENEASAETYEDANNVLLDLQVADRKFDIYLERSGDDISRNNKLDIPPNSFYGRETEVTKMIMSFHSVVKVDGRPALVSVSAFGGMGKTALIDQIKEPLKQAGGYPLIHGKFDPSARPDSVIFGAFNTFFCKIIDETEDIIKQEMKSRIQRVSGWKMLIESIPSLGRLLGQEPTDSALHQEQWIFLVCKLIAAISTKLHPIVFFFDDLQWADETSLSAIQTWVLDPEIRYSHYLVCFRDDEDDAKARVTKILDGIQSHGVPVSRIKLGPIPKSAVNTMCSENLQLPSTLCQSLSNIVHNRTGGVVLFVINLLKSLCEEGLLRFNLSSRRWEYDKRRIETSVINADVSGVTMYLNQQMTRLEHKIQLGLKVAACFGFTIDSDVLITALSGLGVDMMTLDEIVSSGYLQKLSSKQFRWQHDAVHQAAYDLISVASRKKFHLLIGSRLLINTPQEEKDSRAAIFDIVRHLNIGSDLMTSQAQKEEVARLNVNAGTLATKYSSFHSAANYFNAAISLHGEGNDANYEFLMNVYDLSLEPLFAIGDLSKLEQIIESILSLSKTFQEKLKAYRYQNRILTSQFKVEEVIQKTLFVLQQLGETLPTQITKDYVLNDLQQAQKMLSGYAGNELLALPKMTDKNKLAAMQFYSGALTPSYAGGLIMFPLLVVRMVTLSVEYGLCELSSVAFSAYAAILTSNSCKDPEGAARMGRTAIEIMKKVGTEKQISRVCMFVYGFVFVLTEPFQAALEKHLEAYDKGCLAGEMDIAHVHLLQYGCSSLWACGDDLVVHEKRARKHIQRAIQFTQWVPLKTMLQSHSIVLSLMGSSEDTYSTFLNTTEEKFFQEATTKDELLPCRMIITKRMYIAFLSHDMDESLKWFRLRLKFREDHYFLPRLAGMIITEFILGLIPLYFARRSKEQNHDGEDWVAMGEKTITLMRSWAASSEWNYSNKLHLLEAEYYFVKGEEDRATESYNSAIEAARAHKFVHEEGLGNDLAARFHLHYGRKKEALMHFQQAIVCYERWGARSLVRKIEEEIKRLS